MNAAQRHRGPDAEGVWASGRAALGHRRLSIIDLSPEAHQPLLNEDRTIGVTVNGEIYNFALLRADLVAKGHTFRSNSDSEVVLHLYEEYGADGIAKLSGMFAFALWDSRAQRLVLARDRAGKSRSSIGAHRGAASRSRRSSTRSSAAFATYPSSPTTPPSTSTSRSNTFRAR